VVDEAPPIGSVQDLADFIAERVLAGQAKVPTMDVVEEALATI
jgi:hypothetical protein